MSNTVTTREEMNLITAINSGLRQEMARDPAVIMYGYDIGPIGGVFRVTEGLYDEFGPQRVIDTPLSENGVLGTAVGMAVRGLRPVVEMQFMGFFYNSFGQFVCSVANMYERTGGLCAVPMTIRMTFGGGIKPLLFHSESTETFLAHTPAVRVVCPSSPYQAKGMMAASIRSDDPVVFLEHTKQYRARREPVPTEEYLLSLDKAEIIKPGKDVTVIAWGGMVEQAQLALKNVDADVELIDLRSLAPLDVETILTSVKKTGRCVVVHEARRTLGPGAEISALVHENLLEWLLAPVQRVTAFDVNFPDNQTEDFYLPDAQRIQYGIEKVMNYRY
ncbi:MAG: alpha-ketoacid dehydrogenase subunit beta [Gammaproteobacteria bacterium]|nr:alpha-ketoacid dehydrogenase subunit beta [Gammaproteobacteria bacterium]